jgi:hypothetical protein
MVSPKSTTTSTTTIQPKTKTVTPTVPTVNNSSPAVKKSTTGICHAIGTTYYSKTTNYTAYNSIADCLASGGRLPLK